MPMRPLLIPSKHLFGGVKPHLLLRLLGQGFTIGITSPAVLAPQFTHLGGGGGVTPYQAPTNPTTSPPHKEQLPILCSLISHLQD